MPKELTEAQLLLRTHLSELGYETEVEYQFHPDRRFRFDLANVENRLGFEACGGQWTGGHRHRAAITRDYEKLNLAQVHGWRCFYFTNEQILKGEALEWLKEHLS